MQKTIFIVEDEIDLADLLRHHLQKEGYACRVIEDGRTAVGEIQRQRPALVILDRMLPGMSGDEVIAQLKRDPQTAAIPVIMLTAKAEESDALVGFALGADDYVTKPYSVKVVLARVNAVLRRLETPGPETEVYTAGPVRLDVSRHEVTVHETPVGVTSTEFRLLKVLIQSNGRVLSRGQLIDRVLGTGVAVTDRTIDVHITALRRKLNSAAAWIQTVRGVGYTLRSPE